MEPQNNRDEVMQQILRAQEALRRTRERSEREVLAFERGEGPQLVTTTRLVSYSASMDEDEFYDDEEINDDDGPREFHLTRNQREMLHRPSSDWKECKRGERCFNAITLDLDDILHKHGVVQ